MAQCIPLTLSGSNLGERHHQLNSLVRDVSLSSVPFELLQDLPEASPIDRLFKIDLASKYRNLDYILKTLKDTDMLYVSRALKCIWLLEPDYETKINVNFLEKALFPEMTTTAVNKMLHWIQHHLHDPDRCQGFYKYYKDREFKMAVKFLWHCSGEYILEEFKDVIDKIGPYDLKVLSEKCPQLIKIFYENLEQNRNALERYLDNETGFLIITKYVLKSDPNTFFDVIEKYFNVQKCKAFGPDITKYIMINHRQRFYIKTELYTAWLLDMNIIAKCLNPQEIKDVIIKLARAEYLENWFTYKKVEPLIKRLEKDEMMIFKKRIFVDKDFGDKTKDWPYLPPCPPIMKEIPGYNLIIDKEYNEFCVKKITKKRLIQKKCIRRSVRNEKFVKCRTLLVDLFDRYRFMSFEGTIFELRRRLKAESKLQNREFMILVLVSKSGGRENSLRSLLELLSQYRNEPVHFRAAIVRSLVKRAFVWRLPDDLWANLLQWAHGMGLDGGTREIICSEGLHAVVLRNLLANRTNDPAVSKLFFENFTYFTQYSLSAAERSFLKINLPQFILAAAASEIGYAKRMRLKQLLNTLEEYKIRFDRFPGVIEAIATAAREDTDSAKCLLPCLFDARIARKELFKENFSLIQSNASYINALRHDISVIEVDKFKEIFENGSLSRFEQYFKKLAIYFAESGGLAGQFYAFFERLAETKPDKSLAKPLSILVGKYSIALLKTFESPPNKSAEKSLAVALKSNAHNVRPKIDLNNFDWQAAGAKAIANVVSVSPRNQREELVKELIARRRTIRLALNFTESEDMRCFAYKNMVELRPGVALKTFLKYMKSGKIERGFSTIWNTVKPLITNLEYVKRPRLFKSLEDVKFVPESIKAEYCVLVYQAYIKIDKEMAQCMLCKIENICNEVNEAFFSNLVKDFLENEFIADKLVKDDDKQIQIYCFYIRLIVKFLLLSKSKEIQRERINTLEEPFFQRIEGWWKGSINKGILITLLDSLLEALKYNKVFFDDKYVSCMPLFERIIECLHSMLAIEKWFDVYVKLHLTILYYKAARLSINQKPELFTANSENRDKGIEMFGAIFGKFITHDFEELQEKYFKSIREIYKEELMAYFIKFIDYKTYDQSKEMFVIAFIKSILDEKEAREAHLLAGYIFVQHKNNDYFKYGYDLSGIVDILKEVKDGEFRFCLQN